MRKIRKSSFPPFYWWDSEAKRVLWGILGVRTRSRVHIFWLLLYKWWRRPWHPTLVLLPGKSHGWRSLVGCRPWGRWRRTRLSDFTFTFHFHALEKEMATHSSVLAWRIPGTAEPSGLLSMGLHRVGHNWSDLAAAVAVYKRRAVSVPPGWHFGKHWSAWWWSECALEAKQMGEVDNPGKPSTRRFVYLLIQSTNISQVPIIHWALF